MTRFERPRSVAEAASLLAAGDWAVLAGGTDLYPAHVGRPIARPVLDLSRIDGLRGIRRSESGWTFGATTTWSDVIRAALPPLFDALKAAAREVGGVQIQNAGTVAGNVCNASPAADGVPALLALGAEVELQSTAGSRRLPLEDFVLGSRRTARREAELVSAIHVPARAAGARSVFLKLGGRRYLVISITMVAVLIELDGAGVVARAGVAVGSCSAVARRLPALEARLRGRDAARLAACVEPGDLAPLTPIDDVRASREFRIDATREMMESAVARACRAISYLNAGTFEFLLAPDGAYYFIELNARLQVEHPVSELVTGIDIVREQLKIAAGEQLHETGRAARRGHAIEIRLNAEDPSRGFAPAPGVIERFRPPLGPGIRLDTHVEEGSVISPYYDSLIAKLVVWDEDRHSAIERSLRALGELELRGVPTTREAALEILASETFRSGQYSTSFLEETRLAAVSAS